MKRFFTYLPSKEKNGRGITYRTDAASKTGRNEPCPCGSGLKFKKCCLKEQEAVVYTAVMNAHESNRKAAQEAADA